MGRGILNSYSTSSESRCGHAKTHISQKAGYGKKKESR